MQEDFLKKLNNINKSTFVKKLQLEPMTIVIEKLKNNYSETECNYLRELIRCQKLIIRFTKEEKFSETEEIIELSKKILNTLSLEPKTLGKIFIYPSFAYYTTKREKFSLAKRYISLNIKNDDKLTYKFPILHLHKLHHILNIHQILLKEGKYEKCAILFADIFEYLETFKLKTKYGEGSKKYFDNMLPNISNSSVIEMFINTYVICVWENPKIEKLFLENYIIIKNLEERNSKNEYINALKEYYNIQKSFMSKKPNYRLVLQFFYKYGFFHFDPLRLLILKNLYIQTDDTDNKGVIKEIIKDKLNFKDPLLIIERIKKSNQY